MATRKMNRKEWAMYVELERRNKLLRKELADKKKQSKKPMLADLARKYVPGTIGIGLIASLAMFFFFGWRILLETYLGWVIGVTIVTAYVAAINPKNKK